MSSSPANAMTSLQAAELLNAQRQQLHQMAENNRWMAAFIEKQRALIDVLLEQGRKFDHYHCMDTGGGVRGHAAGESTADRGAGV